MPGPFTHIYAARRVADLLSQQGAFTGPGDGPVAPGQPLGDSSKAAYYAQVMHAYPKLASLGAVGPDMFFFLGDLRGVPGDDFMLALRLGYQLDTWSSENWGPLIKLLTSNNYEKVHPWSAILALALQIDVAWQAFVSTYQEVVAPVVDGFENLANAITGDLLNSLGTVLQQFLSTVEGLFADLALDTSDVLGYFKLIMQSGEDETAFYWSDMLHYRRTSQMAQALLRRAEQLITQNQAQGEQFLAYALGYACHLGVDVVGHAFVNEQAGGPYRTHWQRHHMVENHLDAWVYSQTAGPTLPWYLAGNVEGKNGSPWNFGNVSGCPFFIGDFTGSGKQELMFYYGGDGNWWLARFSGTTMSWTGAGNTSGAGGSPWNFGNISGDKFFTGDFTGSGKTEVLFYSPGDSNWWLGTFSGTSLSWTLAGNTSGFGNVASDPFFTGNFTGTGKTQLLFYSPGNLLSPDDNWWLGTFSGTTLTWTLAGNTRGFGNISGDKFFTANFQGTGRTDVLFYAPGNNAWWLGTFSGTTLNWNLAATTSGFGNVSGYPFFLGHFTGAAQDDIMFYSPASTDGSWWLGTFSGTTLNWTWVGNTRGNNNSPWDFGDTSHGRFLSGWYAGSAAEGMLWASPGGNWMLGFLSGNQLEWTLANNTSGFGNVAPDPFWVGDFTGAGRDEVVFYSTGDGNWWLAIPQPSRLPQDSFCAAIPQYQSLCQSALYFALAFNKGNNGDAQGDLRQVLPDETPPNGYSSAAQTQRQNALDTDGELPDWLAQGIVSAMIETYADTSHPLVLQGEAFQPQMNAALQNAQLPPDPPLPFAVPPGFPLPWEVKTAYKLMLSFFKRAYMDSFDMPVPPPPSGAVPQWPDFGNATGLNTSSPGSFFSSVATDIGNFIGDVLNSIANLIALLTDTVTLQLREQIYNNLTLPAWQAARKTRQALVQTGFLIPENYEVDQVGRLIHPNEIDMSQITLGASTGQPALPDPRYPWQSVTNEYQRPWAYPSTTVAGGANTTENSPTRAGPFAAGALPDTLLLHNTNANNALRLSYESASSTADTDAINASTAFTSASAGGVSPLGDCLKFAAYLIGRLTAAGPPPADFNLDADRGFGYLSWDWVRDPPPAWTANAGSALLPYYVTFPAPHGWEQTPFTRSNPLLLRYLKSRAVSSWKDPTSQHVAYISADGHLRDLASASGTGSWTATDLTAATGGVSAAYGSLTSWIDKTYEHLVCADASGHLHEFYRTLGPAAWVQGDITAASGAPPAGPGELTSWVDSVYEHVVCTTSDGHIHELYFPLGTGPWQSGDLTVAANAPLALPTALTSWVDSVYQHVVYLSADGHIHEMYFKLGTGPWVAGDLTAATGAPPAIPGTLASWLDSTYQHLVFLTADGHVRELRFKLGAGPWTVTDITAAAAVPPAAYTTLTSWVDSAVQHVAYISAGGDVQELYSQLGTEAWAGNDLTRAAGAPPAAGSACALTSWVDPVYEHVAYLASDRHVHELHFALGTGPWVTSDLTTSTGSPP
jgi:hypothetical protein